VEVLLMESLLLVYASVLAFSKRRIQAICKNVVIAKFIRKGI
jgi:hypothetical protein